jgi:hypothetical protein
LSTACSTNVTPYSLPNATISFDKYALTLDQTNNSYTVHGTVTLSDQSEPDHITYVYTDADILPIGFQQVGNNLTISLVPEVTINAQTICIYATYPKSANRPRIPITINVVAYTSPTPEPTPEVWDDT